MLDAPDSRLRSGLDVTLSGLRPQAPECGDPCSEVQGEDDPRLAERTGKARERPGPRPAGITVPPVVARTAARRPAGLGNPGPLPQLLPPHAARGSLRDSEPDVGERAHDRAVAREPRQVHQAYEPSHAVRDAPRRRSQLVLDGFALRPSLPLLDQAVDGRRRPGDVPGHLRDGKREAVAVAQDGQLEHARAARPPARGEKVDAGEQDTALLGER